MADGRVKGIVLRIYDQVNLALWSALVAFLIFCAFVIAPKMPRYRADALAARAAARESEDAFYCRRWQLSEGTASYARCMSDLLEFRRSIERQLADDSLPWPSISKRAAPSVPPVRPSTARHCAGFPPPTTR